MDLETIEREYRADYGRYECLCREIVTQLSELFGTHQISTALPIEWRVKTWSSILDKIKRD